jgi:2-methylcitrate dehydratase PrpD
MVDEITTGDASITLSRFASEVTGEALPASVVSVLERQVLDTLGAMLAASGIGEGCREILELVTRQGGAPDATVLGAAARVPAPAAAFANGAFAHAALELTAKPEFQPAAITEVIVHVGAWGRAFCEPLAERARPRSSATAKNSIPFTVATTLANRCLTLADFTEGGLEEPAARALAQRVRVHFAPELAASSGTEPGVVQVRLVSGDTVSARVDVALGHPSRPLDFDAIATKFRECATYARAVPDAATLEQCVDFIARLPSISDARPLLSMLACGTGK